MASEIEIVAEGGTPRVNGNSALGGQKVEEVETRDDVFTAAAYGDIEKLKNLVEERGCSVSEPDSGGYYALQWSALNNRTAAAQYLVEVCLILPSSRFVLPPLCKVSGE